MTSDFVVSVVRRQKAERSCVGAGIVFIAMSGTSAHCAEKRVGSDIPMEPSFLGSLRWRCPKCGKVWTSHRNAKRCCK